MDVFRRDDNGLEIMNNQVWIKFLACLQNAKFSLYAKLLTVFMDFNLFSEFDFIDSFVYLKPVTTL